MRGEDPALCGVTPGLVAGVPGCYKEAGRASHEDPARKHSSPAAALVPASGLLPAMEHELRILN